MNPEKGILSRKVLFVVGILVALFITVSLTWAYQVNKPKQVEFVWNGENRVLSTKAKTVGQFLQEQKVNRDSYDLMNVALDDKIKNGIKISYTDRWPINITDGNKKLTVITSKKTVADVLAEQKIGLGKLDRTQPAQTESLSPRQTIAITRVEKKVVEEQQTIPFNEVTRKDYALAQGQKKVLQQGQEGKVLHRYEVVYENGQESNRKLVDTQVIAPKQDRVVAIGSLLTVSRGGTSFTARKILNNVLLTAYAAGVSHTGKQPGDPEYAITRSGRRAQEGRTIAVDPRVIPLGTWVYIEGIGFRRAEDTGSAVKGQKIDVYFEDDRTAENFGLRRSKAVYVIGRNKPE